MSQVVFEACKFAVNNKNNAIRNGTTKNLNPLLIVEKNDHPAVIFSSPNNNLQYVMGAASVSKVGFNPQSLTVIFDITYKPKDTKHNKYDVDFEECEAILVYNIDKDNNVKSVMIPYTINFDQIEWHEQIECATEDELRGHIPKKLKVIMGMSSLTREKPDLLEILNLEKDDLEGFDDEKFEFFSGRAVISILMKKKFKVIDLFTYKHIEWTDAKNKAKAFINALVEMKKIDKKHENKFLDLVEKNIGSPAFHERFEHQLSVVNFKPPKKMGLNTFVSMFQQVCMSPGIESTIFSSGKDDN